MCRSKTFVTITPLRESIRKGLWQTEIHVKPDPIREPSQKLQLIFYNFYHQNRNTLYSHKNSTHSSFNVFCFFFPDPVTLHSEGQNKNNGLYISNGSRRHSNLLIFITHEKELVIQAYFTTSSPSPVRCDSLLINLSDIKWSHLSCRHSLFAQVLFET